MAILMETLIIRQDSRYPQTTWLPTATGTAASVAKPVSLSRAKVSVKVYDFPPTVAVSMFIAT